MLFFFMSRSQAPMRYDDIDDYDTDATLFSACRVTLPMLRQPAAMPRRAADIDYFRCQRAIRHDMPLIFHCHGYFMIKRHDMFADAATPLRLYISDVAAHTTRHDASRRGCLRHNIRYAAMLSDAYLFTPAADFSPRRYVTLELLRRYVITSGMLELPYDDATLQERLP